MNLKNGRISDYRPFVLLGQGPVFIVEFFVDPKNETLKTNKPPAMQVSQHCFSLQ